ncbi:hypothetical protein GCM10009850_053570 [Nonomuraea monospora]|uniref:Uncharacterized protein n=1 Tax=Nonomuraea monospora TaxID=568818 RepID=A0ABN3CKK8_9ACTN
MSALRSTPGLAWRVSMRITCSIWLAMAVHTVNNLTLPLLVCFTGTAGLGTAG